MTTIRFVQQVTYGGLTYVDGPREYEFDESAARSLILGGYAVDVTGVIVKSAPAVTDDEIPTIQEAPRPSSVDVGKEILGVASQVADDDDDPPQVATIGTSAHPASG